MAIKEAKEHLEKAYALAASVHVCGRDVDFLAGARAEMQMAFQALEKAEETEEEAGG